MRLLVKALNFSVLWSDPSPQKVDYEFCEVTLVQGKEFMGFWTLSYPWAAEQILIAEE